MTPSNTVGPERRAPRWQFTFHSKDTRNKEGFVDIVAAQATDDPHKVIFRETWETAEDDDAHFQWQAETGFMDATGPFLAKPPVRSVLNLVS